MNQSELDGLKEIVMENEIFGNRVLFAINPQGKVYQDTGEEQTSGFLQHPEELYSIIRTLKETLRFNIVDVKKR